MRTSHFKYQFFDMSQIASGYGSCFQACKIAKFFSYDFLDSEVYCFNGKSIQESIDREVQLTQMLIKEFKLDVVFEYTRDQDGKNTFAFSIQKPGYYDLYACVIMSRYFVSDVSEYRQLVSRIDYLVDEEYTPMEAYIIASLYNGDGSFSFSGKYLLDINKYRSISKKKEFLLKRSSRTMINANFRKISKYQLSQDDSFDMNFDQMEKQYYNLLSEVADLDRMLLVLDEHKFRSIDTLVAKKYPGRYFSTYRNGRICIEQGAMRSVNALHKFKKEFDKDPNNPEYDKMIQIGGANFCKEHLESIKLVDIKDFILANADYFRNSLTPTGKGLSKRWPAGWLFDLHTCRNFDLIEEINNLKIIPNKLSKWNN